MELLFGVPQGFVLGPLMFLLYSAELFDVVACSGLVGYSYSYADDTQVYIGTPATSASTIAQRFASCVEQVDAWMSSNRQSMNADRTQLIWLGTKQQLDELSMTELDLLSATVRFSTAVCDLGVLVDSQLSMADHVASLSRTCLLQLRQLRLVRSSMFYMNLESEINCIHLFIHSFIIIIIIIIYIFSTLAQNRRRKY